MRAHVASDSQTNRGNGLPAQLSNPRITVMVNFDHVDRSRELFGMTGFPHGYSSKSRAPLSSVEQGADERPTLSDFAEEELTESDALSCFAEQGYESATRWLSAGTVYVVRQRSIRAIRRTAGPSPERYDRASTPDLAADCRSIQCCQASRARSGRGDRRARCLRRRPRLAERPRR